MTTSEAAGTTGGGASLPASDAIQPDRTNEQREERLRAVLAQMFAGYPPAPTPAKSGGSL